ncbi:type II toxin-antitoxin system PemK/MazF family toxin [Candidatus Woesearchaeota archaeon]|nr:type II toxin-antitoxin system PemK/MazF family toxin [Candidatus Woesearchaeota archaeon]
MRSGTMFEQGDIVVVPFPFTDLSATKQRPALVISKTGYNSMTDDVITCAITSNLQGSDYSVLIDNDSLTEGAIPTKSRVKVDKLFTISKLLVKKKVAKLGAEEFSKVKAELQKLV